MNQDKLKQQLQKIADQKYAPPTDAGDMQDLIQAMLVHMGDPDPVLRDELIYMTLGTWISDGHVEPDRLKEILRELLDDQHLFCALGDSGDDTLFTRSFSMLMLQPIVEQHLKNPFLTNEEVLNMLDSVLRYLAGEQDLRGHVADKGWGHAVAHTADVLDELVQCDVLQKAELLKVLGAIQVVMCAPDAIFQYEEDERMVTAVTQTWKRNLISHEEINDWLQGFISSQPPWANMPSSYQSYLNCKQFLRSLYFVVQHEPGNKPVADVILEVLGKLK